MMEEENSCVGPSRRFKIPVSATIPIFQHFLSRTPSRCSVPEVHLHIQRHGIS